MNSTVMRSHPVPRGTAGWRAFHKPAVSVFGAALFAVTGCGADGDGAAPNPAAAPTNVRWQDFQGVALPSADQGPRSFEGGAATDFDHSPPGAAVAAITHTVRLSVAADNQWARVVAEEVVPGPARDEWSVNRLQLSITGPAAAEYTPRLLGYKITDYTEQRTAVDIYTEYSDGSKAVNHTTVEWFQKDWRLRLPDPNSTTRPVEAIDVLPDDIVTLEAPK
ncbi:hypothetical protein [Nocardia sp. NPDC050710]|uniref:hypothetical protein n=1 Tax=Nocardia sp. NPDC050710 TaxID=3157220 RepID=UPI0033C139F3